MYCLDEKGHEFIKSQQNTLDGTMGSFDRPVICELARFSTAELSGKEKDSACTDDGLAVVQNADSDQKWKNVNQFFKGKCAKYTTDVNAENRTSLK